MQQGEIRTNGKIRRFREMLKTVSAERKIKCDKERDKMREKH